MRQLDYTVVDSYELVTRDSFEYGYSSNAGRDDREGQILMVETKNGTLYVDYRESYYRFSCTKNEEGVNTIYLNDEEYVVVESGTTDFHYTIYSSYKEAVESIRKIEDYGYYIVRF